MQTGKLALSLLAVIAALGLAGTGAFAFFSDTETSSNNTFTAGTLDLKLTDYNEWVQDGVTRSWSMDNMAPGVSSTNSWYVMLSNSGTVIGDHVEISFSNEIDEGTPIESETDGSNTAEQMAQWLEIVGISYTGVNFSSTAGHVLVNSNGTPFIDLDDLADDANAAALDNLLTPPANSSGSTALFMDIKFNAGAGNDFQGDTLTSTITFTLNQDASQ